MHILSDGLCGLSRRSSLKSRSISPENFTGEKGKGGMALDGTGAGAARGLGQGWKISPSVEIAPGEGGFSDELTAAKKAPQLSVENWTLEFGLNSIPLYYWEHSTLSAVDLISNCHTGTAEVPED